MSLVLEQHFPLGRFHATRWNQNPFEDPYGEWPPSPWRLLRALAARWIQYSRETGDDQVRGRDQLLRTLASTPSFRLPERTWRGLAILQYQPTALEEQYKYKKDPRTKKSVLDYSYKHVSTTLVPDHYRVLSPEEPVCWIWTHVLLTPNQSGLLQELLRRILYFGRAESFCRFRIAELSDGIRANCVLVPTPGGAVPVLVPDPNTELDLDTLLAATDDQLIARRRTPPGSAWYYAPLPPCPSARPQEAVAPSLPSSLRVVQFAVGGRVYPALERWVKVTERFRNEVLRRRAVQLTGNPDAEYRNLTEAQRDAVSLFSGKNGRGQPLRGHPHTYFLLWPDEHGQPTRLVCVRSAPFTRGEVEALFAASERTYGWGTGGPDWRVRIVPLPFETPDPQGLFGESSTWVSATPFVPPGNRQRFRKGGRERAGEAPAMALTKLLVKSNFPAPVSVLPLSKPAQTEWVYVHAAPAERERLRQQRTLPVRAGYRFRIRFPQAVRGPILTGHSTHFGLGLFVPEAG